MPNGQYARTDFDIVSMQFVGRSRRSRTFVDISYFESWKGDATEREITP